MTALKRPFTVLHVCIGNICRSPMAERLLALALAQHLGEGGGDGHYRSHGAGTGSWHVGEPMHPSAARQLRLRGGRADGFVARRLTDQLIDESDLILCATAEQVHRVLALRPDAVAITFVLGEFGRLLEKADLSGLPPAGNDSLSRYQRGVALVAAVDAARQRSSGSREPSRASDDLDDPWGLPDSEYVRAADQIEHTVQPLAAALLGQESAIRAK